VTLVDEQIPLEACDALAGWLITAETPVDSPLTWQLMACDEDCGFTVTYADVADGDCPVVVTRTFTAT
jgi:hypothetical protein